MLGGKGSDQIVLKSPYMNRDLGLQLDDGNWFLFCNHPKILAFDWNGPLLLFHILLALHSCHISFFTCLEMQGYWTSHIVSHLKKEWDSKESRLQLRYFHHGNKKPKHTLILRPNALSMPLFHFAIKGEKFHDLDFMSLNGFLKWCKS